MTFLVLHWGAYTHSDILQTLKKMNIHYKVVEYVFKDKNKDELFESWFSEQLKGGSYDAVFTVNYFPLVAKVCAERRTKYLSWCYDCPLNVLKMEETLGLETNYVFLFDRMQVKQYQDMGFKNVFHLPLAVNTERLSHICLNREEWETYLADVSFVGRLYESPYPVIASMLDDYTQGYLTAVIETQLKVYGAFFMDHLLTDDLLSGMNRQLADSNQKILTSISKEQLSFAMATYITHKERIQILAQLSERYCLKLYSGDENELLKNVIGRGRVSYVEEMPKVFAASKVNLNITVKNIQSGIPLRALDILGCGGFLISNYQPELTEYFIPDEDFVCYESIEDATEKVDYYLKNDLQREKIAINGRRKCHENFDYVKQLSALLQMAHM